MRTANLAGAACALALVLQSLPAQAGPADYVYTPTVEYGEREIDLKYGTAKSRDGTRESAFSTGVGLGVNEWWFTEFYGKWHKEPGDRTSFDAWEWENKFQLTQTGRYPVDVGFIVELERPKDRSEGYEVRWGPLLQTEISSMWQANLNLLVTKHYRASSPSPAELGYQWQLKYRYKAELEFGAQGFGGVGPLAHWAPASEQTHIAGPAIFGKFRVGQKQVIKYNAAVLYGLNHGAPRNTFRMQAEYEF